MCRPVWINLMYWRFYWQDIWKSMTWEYRKRKDGRRELAQKSLWVYLWCTASTELLFQRLKIKIAGLQRPIYVSLNRLLSDCLLCKLGFWHTTTMAWNKTPLVKPGNDLPIWQLQQNNVWMGVVIRGKFYWRISVWATGCAVDDLEHWRNFVTAVTNKS